MKKTTLLAILAATAAIAQAPPEGPTGPAGVARQATASATATVPALTKLDRAKAAMDRAEEEQAEAKKKADAAADAYRKLQGRIEPTTEQANEMLLVYNEWQAEIIAYNVTLPQQFEEARKRSQEGMKRLAQRYQASLAALKAANNAAVCEGLDQGQHWAGCKNPPTDK